MSEQETQGGSNSGSDNPDVDVGTLSETEAATPYYVFEQCITRAKNLISVHESTQEIDEMSEAHYGDCYRAAVVLSISALDAFIRKIIVSEIRKLVADDTKPLNTELSDYLKGLLNQDKLLDAARKYNLLDAVEKAMKEDFSTKSFQGEWKISSHLSMVGYKDVFSQVSIKADVNEKNLKKKLSVFTMRRHVIAHSGDYDLNQIPHKENEISKTYAEDCIKTVSLFAKTINQLMEEK